MLLSIYVVALLIVSSPAPAANAMVSSMHNEPTPIDLFEMSLAVSFVVVLFFLRGFGYDGIGSAWTLIDFSSGIACCLYCSAIPSS